METTDERAASSQIAALNHFFAVVDDETAEAIKNSPFLQQFADFSVQTISAAGSESWTGRYVRGRQTYVELFSVSDLADSGDPSRLGASGIAVSGDRQGALSLLQRRLEAAGIETKTEMRKSQRENKEIDWFQSLTILEGPDEPSVSSIWAMEYVDTFFEEMRKEAPEGPDDIISRERYLPDGYKDHMMLDVRSIDVAVTGTDFRRIEQMLTAAGFEFSRDNGTVRTHGADLDLVFRVVAVEQIGVRSIEFILNAPAPAVRVERIGKSTLTVGPGDRARWVFGSPTTLP